MLLASVNSGSKGGYYMIKQNLKKIPSKLLKEKRWIPVTHEKKPKITAWSDPQNQSLPNDLELPIAFDITARHPFLADNYLVFDFDHILDEAGNFVTEEARIAYEQVKALSTFGELSQSGSGFHFVVVPTRDKFPTMGPKKLYFDRGYRPDGTKMLENQRAKLEIFYKTGGRYFVFTGNLIEGSGDILRSSTVDNVISDFLRQIYEQQGKEKLLKEASVNSDNQTAVTFNENGPTDLERAKRMLDFIKPSGLDYYDWLAIGMALKNIGASAEDFDEWSKDDDRYEEGECFKKFNGFTREGYTIATIYYFAEKGGYNERAFRREWYAEHNIERSTTQTVNMQDYLNNCYASDTQKLRSESKIKTGLSNLDDTIEYVSPGLYVIGAIPSLGKTTLMHQIADNMAIAGEYVLFFSLEQTPLELANKSLARESYKLNPQLALTSWGLLRGYDEEERQRLSINAMAHYREAIDDRLIIIPSIHSITVDDIERITEEFIEKTDHKPVIIIDYLQILGVEDVLSDKMRIDKITTKLKQLQSRHSLIMFLISSFNRSNYMQTADFESFKESGNIEYSADAIWALQLQVLDSTMMTAQETGRNGTTKSQKRLIVEGAKNASPRRILLKALKHRNHPLYSVGFLYHSAHDYFEPDPCYSNTQITPSDQEDEDGPEY